MVSLSFSPAIEPDLQGSDAESGTSEPGNCGLCCATCAGLPWSRTCWLSEELPSQVAQGHDTQQKQAAFAGKTFRFRASEGLCSNSSQRLGHVQEDYLTWPTVEAKKGVKRGG